MSLFAVSDIHGYYDETIKSLTESGFFGSDDNKLVVVGDALDRGEQPNEIVDFMLGLHRQGRLIYIYGNHEELFYNCLQEIAAGGINRIASGMSHHYSNRTFHTLVGLSGLSVNEAILYPDHLVARVKASDYYRLLLPNAVNYYETEKHSDGVERISHIRSVDITGQNIYDIDLPDGVNGLEPTWSPRLP